jgi:hypothetical protein
MSATTTQLLSSGEFCKLRYETIPIKSASAKVSFYTSNSKMPNFELTLLSQMSDFHRNKYVYKFHYPFSVYMQTLVFHYRSERRIEEKLSYTLLNISDASCSQGETRKDRL